MCQEIENGIKQNAEPPKCQILHWWNTQHLPFHTDTQQMSCVRYCLGTGEGCISGATTFQRRYAARLVPGTGAVRRVLPYSLYRWINKPWRCPASYTEDAQSIWLPHYFKIAPAHSLIYIPSAIRCDSFAWIKYLNTLYWDYAVGKHVSCLKQK